MVQKDPRLRLPENLKLILETQENNNGLIVQFNKNLWAIFRKNLSDPDDYGLQIVNPDTDERSDLQWGLTHKQCIRLIEKLVKTPGYGFG